VIEFALAIQAPNNQKNKKKKKPKKKKLKKGLDAWRYGLAGICVF
jgi:hypothetical protein